MALDVMEFEDALERAEQARRRGEVEGEEGNGERWRQAVDSYRGDLLLAAMKSGCWGSGIACTVVCVCRRATG